MIYTAYYNSPLGKILLASKDNKLIGLWIQGQKHYLSNLKEEFYENNNDEILVKTKKWLDRYFNNKKPDINELKLNPMGSQFKKSVWKILCKIPYGKVTTYGKIAEQTARQKGITKMSAQAIGVAIGRNPISIIIPCHRVVGTDGKLTGYAGGIDKKIFLLKHENVDMNKFFAPKKGTDL